MAMLIDFRCPDNHVHEQLVKADTQSVRCGCGKTANRVISGGHFFLDGSSAAFPTAHDRWVREHEKSGNNSKMHSHGER